MHTLTKIAVTTAASLLLCSNAMALSFDGLTGKTVILQNGDYGTTAGGEFKIDVLGSGEQVDYLSFCLEMDEHISYGTPYTIASVTNYATGGGNNIDDPDGQDPISDQTKWVYWNYLQGNLGTKTNDLANAVQTAIWYLENEIGYSGLSDATLYNNWIAKGKESNYFITGDVRVLNLERDGVKAQSQLVAAPVPEPTTILLFGTGLIGLAGIARRRQNA